MALAKRSGGQAGLKTAEGERLAKGSKLSVAHPKGNTARITTANVRQSNGMIHVIDKVVMP